MEKVSVGQRGGSLMETKYTCPNCGREYMKKDTAKFCKFCGHKIVEQPPQGQTAAPVAPMPIGNQSIPPGNPKQPKKKGGMVAAIIAGIVLLL